MARINPDTVSSDYSFVARCVRCIETKELFGSIKNAAFSVGVSSSSISDCLHGKKNGWRLSSGICKITEKTKVSLLLY